MNDEPNNQLALAENRGFMPRGYDEMMKLATAVVNSKLAPKDLSSPDAVLVAMQHGMELGLSPMQAVQSVAVINGRPCVWGDAALALVKSHPECDDVIETFVRTEGDETHAKCVVKRRGKAEVERHFSVAQAKKANLWGKAGPWTQYPQRMLQMRARSWALRDAFPDALKGVGIVEEHREARPVQAREVKSTLVLPDSPPVPALTNGDDEPEHDAAEFVEPTDPLAVAEQDFKF